MNKHKYVKFYIFLPLILIFILLIEGIVATYFRGIFFTSQYAIVSQLLIVITFVIALWFQKSSVYSIVIVIFLLYDVCYSPFLSFYTIAVVISLVVIRLFHRINKTFFSDFLIMILGLLTINIVLYIESSIVGYNVQQFQFYFSYKVIPTVLFNLFAWMILYVPLKRLLIWVER